MLLLPTELKWLRFVGVVIGMCAATVVQGQELTNWREQQLVIDTDTLQVDSLSIAPGSFSLMQHDSIVPASRYGLDPFHARLIWYGTYPGDTLVARYRVMPLLLGGPYRHKDPQKLITTAGDRIDPFKYVPPKGGTDLLGLPGLNKTGSISRGVLFGNNQDLSVNSTLNLELSGRLTDRINVLASITDNNIPIQAEGNTLELQDFDQVFIKLFDDPDPVTGAGWDLIAGDMVLQRPKSHFLSYMKKVKGLGYGLRTGDQVRNEIVVGAAISKGKFARQLIQGVEGVQGPYRLRGDAGESFIIVLSGTEQVFIDGQSLTRGQENDYVIDYNAAELVFTANRMITKDRRIVVEFQYSDKNYARSLVRVSDELTMGDTRMRLHVFSEQDHKNQPLQQALDEDEKLALSEAGDDPLAAVVNGADSVGFNIDQVLYAQIDSLGYSPVYLYSTSEDSALYRVTFTQVGAGKGDYVQASFTPNGRVYKWVGPDTIGGQIIPRGDHAPLRVLITPKRKQMVALGVEHRFSARTSLTTEVAVSNNDLNSFSAVDGNDDVGTAARAAMTHDIPLRHRDSTLVLVVGGDVESFTREFSVVERYRAVEFERNWNALATPLDNDQLLAGASVGVRSNALGRASLKAATLQVRDRYSGWNGGTELGLHPGRWVIEGEASLLTTNEPFTSDFLRHKSRLARKMRWITVGYRDEHERNRFRADSSTAISTGSYQFHEWEAYVQSPDTFRNKWRVAAGQRHDRAASMGRLLPTAEATQGSVFMELARNSSNRLATTFTYRSLAILDTLLTAQKPENSYLARIDYDLRALKNAVSLDLFYEFGSGLEPRKEFIYVLVPAGQGLYVWIDYNGNGVKELNEFELANFSYEADHIRVYVPTNDYVRTFSNQLNTSLDLRPAAAWADAKGLKRFIARFSDLAMFRTDRKTGTSDLGHALDPLRIDPADTAITAFSSSVRNTFYYDRTSRTWSVDHTYQNDRNKSLLLNGFESRVREVNQLRLRWNTSPQWTAEMEGETGRVASNSDLIEGRTYAIDQRALRPRLIYQPGTTFRASLTFKVTTKVNEEALGGQAAEIQDLGTDLRYNTPGTGGIQATFNLVRISYDGEVNSSLGNEMLAGLKPGNNLTWSVGLQRKLSDHLQIDLTYNGRRSEGVKAVHVGGAQVRAFF